jgi:hypothetical protein
MSTLSTVSVAALTSVATSSATALTVGSRLQARNARIQAVHADRDKFNDHVVAILGACGALQDWAIADDATDELREKLEGESERWLARIDEATQWMIDNSIRVALSWPDPIRTLVGRYVSYARGIWLSERPQPERLRMLNELTAQVQTIFFIRTWHFVSRAKAVPRLRAMLDALNTPQAPAAVHATNPD